MKRYVYMLEPSDRAELSDDDMGGGEDRVLDCLADRHFLAAALLRLKPREERVIRLRYGIGGIGEHTYREIGDDLDTTVENVRQIHLKSLRKLRWHARRFDPARMAEQQRLDAVRPAPPNPMVRQHAMGHPQKPRVSRPRRAPQRPSPQVNERPIGRGPEISPGSSPARGAGFWEWMLFWLAGCYLIALAFDSALAFNLSKATGGVPTLLLHLSAALFGLMINAIVLFELQSFGDWSSSPMSPPWLARIIAVLFTGAVSGLLDPVQRLLRDIVAATPDEFKSPTSTIVLVFSAAIVLVAVTCLIGIRTRGRTA